MSRISRSFCDLFVCFGRHVGSNFHSAVDAAKSAASSPPSIAVFAMMAVGTAGTMCLALWALKKNI